MNVHSFKVEVTKNDQSTQTVELTRADSVYVVSDLDVGFRHTVTITARCESGANDVEYGNSITYQQCTSESYL